MKYILLILYFLLPCFFATAQQTTFEKSGGNQTATYHEAISWYKKLAVNNSKIRIKDMGPTDAGYPLNLVMLSADGTFDPIQWHKRNKLVILVNNGIHPGEPDGIDASMMLVRDILNNKIKLPSNVVMGFIPVYNIGGCLNRNSYTRANQNGPDAYGFRGNSQNLDLNRDFTKEDSREASSFAQIFHFLDPDILVDNHVSDGADYQHTMTLISTQYEKLGPVLGKFLKEKFEPAIYSSMSGKTWEIIPYVDFDNAHFEKGIRMFYDPPRYSSGYAALFSTLSFMPETHMLKPYNERVKATYELMQSFIEEGSKFGSEIISARKRARTDELMQSAFPLKWVTDSSRFGNVTFRGYTPDTAISEATGLKKMFYNHNKPYSASIKYFNFYKPVDFVDAPAFYIVPAGWLSVVERLQVNGIKVRKLTSDTFVQASVYHLDQYKTLLNPYEKHHKNYNVKVSRVKKQVRLLAGDFIISANQQGKRYLIEMLEPTGDDSFFSWNFFDAVLQQKEGYSDYRWEDIAAGILRDNPAIKIKMEEKKSADPAFAKNSSAILAFIYENSAWLEQAYLNYPVYRIEF